MSSPASPPRNWPRIAAYSLPILPMAIVVFPAYTILPSFYARHTAIPLSVIGTILIVARLFDAIVDPVIGMLSDNTKSRWGPRKPWIAAGVVVLMVSVYQLYVPAPTVGPVYYLSWFLIFYLGYSLIEIGHKAWGTDLARDYLQRSAISTWLAVSFSIGNLIFAIVPFLTPGGARTYDAENLRIAALIVIILLPLSAIIAFALAPKAPPLKSLPTKPLDIVRALGANRPLANFVTIYLLTGLGQGIFYGLVFLYVGSIMALDAHFAYFLLGDAIVSLAAAPFWYWVIKVLEKHRAWAVGLAIAAAAILAMWLVPPGEDSFTILLILILIRAFGAAVIYVVPNALLGDVVDYEIWRAGANRAGNFHALVSLLTKISAALGGGLGLILVGLFGFVPDATNSAAAISGFKTVALGVSSFVLAMAVMLAIRFPLNRRRHDVVRRRILGRAGGDG